MTYLYAVPVLAVGFAVILLARLQNRKRTDVQLIERARPDLAERLMPFSCYMDRDELWAAIGGMDGLVAIYHACGAVATLVARHVRSKDAGAKPIEEQVFIAALCARFLALLAIGEAVFRKMLPIWPPVFAASLVQLFCSMTATLNALEIYAC